MSDHNQFWLLYPCHYYAYDNNNFLPGLRSIIDKMKNYLFIFINSIRTRFPSMESNIEARNKPDSNYFHGNHNRYSVYPSNNSFAMRQNGSLPRKFTTNTSIPVRTDYYNYSHGKQNFQAPLKCRYSTKKKKCSLTLYTCVNCHLYFFLSFWFNFINHYNFDTISCCRRFE